MRVGHKITIGPKLYGPLRMESCARHFQEEAVTTPKKPGPIEAAASERELLKVPDAVRLLRAYGQLDGNTRQLVVDLVENFAVDAIKELPEQLPVRPTAQVRKTGRAAWKNGY